MILKVNCARSWTSNLAQAVFSAIHPDLLMIKEEISTCSGTPVPQDELNAVQTLLGLWACILSEISGSYLTFRTPPQIDNLCSFHYRSVSVNKIASHPKSLSSRTSIVNAKGQLASVNNKQPRTGDSHPRM